ncbi:hypothetical protein MYX64_13490, partial [Nitrospinae bacterium AH_259_B05_G02_I21]|nr:hypothetical protein [Nitrospinae bacterium AH_259_B05_G02_I21]
LGHSALLPEVATRFATLDVDTYDPDALGKLTDILLAEGFEAEALQLAEHFLPVMRTDDALMPYAVPEVCGLVLELRVGQ